MNVAVDKMHVNLLVFCNVCFSSYIGKFWFGLKGSFSQCFNLGSPPPWSFSMRSTALFFICSSFFMMSLVRAFGDLVESDLMEVGISERCDTDMVRAPTSLC